MKTSYQLALAAAFAVMAVASVQAQTTGGRSREAVEAEAIATAHAPDQNVTRGSRGPETVKPMADADAVYQQAVATAHAADQNVTRGSRGPETVKPMADPAKVYNEAVAAASAPDQNVVSGSRVNSKVISTMQNPALTAAQGK
jgi:tartrate dehydratase beta subunit/fumarate hydratase class I family protein